jgi:hypothetical protein
MISFQSFGLGLYPKSILDIAVQPDCKPIFEILSESKHFKIYADGRVEGFESAVVINRIPTALFEAKLGFTV